VRGRRRRDRGDASAYVDLDASDDTHADRPAACEVPTGSEASAPRTEAGSASRKADTACQQWHSAEQRR
jgi:hypothetical protein